VSSADSKVSPTSFTPAVEGELSLETLAARHYRFVWRILRGLGLSRTDAEDAAQQVFMIAARKLATITPERTRSFLYGTALRVAGNARRSARRRREVPGDDGEVDEAPELAQDGPEEQSELVRARALLGELLQQLPEKLRRVMVLAEIEQLEIRQIAELEAVPVGTAASRLRLARQQFRVLLERTRDRNPFAEKS
jgi:RNA polymerase sigma-70 factor (ECF subfamily)